MSPPASAPSGRSAGPTRRTSRSASRGFALTARDTRIVDTVARLGAADAETIRRLHAPGNEPRVFSRRLGRLRDAGLLKQTRPLGPAVTVYLLGKAALGADQGRPWHPPEAQTYHTLEIGRTLVALLRPELLPGITVRRWEGEAELRGWEQPGQPRPDLVLHLTLPGSPHVPRQGPRHVPRHDPQHDPQHAAELDPGPAPAPQPGEALALPIEVDRGTEAAAAWRRKLARYDRHRHYPGRGRRGTYDPILAVTTTDVRARSLANLAAAAGAPLIAMGKDALAGDTEPSVYDSRDHRMRRLGEALARTQSTGRQQPLDVQRER